MFTIKDSWYTSSVYSRVLAMQGACYTGCLLCRVLAIYTGCLPCRVLAMQGACYAECLLGRVLAMQGAYSVECLLLLCISYRSGKYLNLL